MGKIRRIAQFFTKRKAGSVVLYKEDVLMLMHEYTVCMLSNFNELDHVMIAEAFKLMNEQHSVLPENRNGFSDSYRFSVHPKHARALKTLLSVSYERMAQFSLCTKGLFDAGIMRAADQNTRIRIAFNKVS